MSGILHRTIVRRALRPVFSGQVRMPVTLMAVMLLAGAARALPAQSAQAMHISPEIRGDVLFGGASAVQAGAGMQVPLGTYVRLGADAALGLRTGAVAGSRVDARIDMLGRFLLDPFRQSRYGFSAGAGLSTRFERGARTTPLLLVALELEGRRAMSGWVPALQVAVAGGARVGLVLRRGAAGAR
jgi:hypothetical protein